MAFDKDYLSFGDVKNDIIISNGNIVGTRSQSGNETLFPAATYNQNGELQALLNAGGGVGLSIYPNREYPVQKYGEVSLAKKYTGAISAGSNIFTVNGYSFTASDLGKTIGIEGAGVISTDFSTLANDGVYVSTIIDTNNGSAVLSDVAINTVLSADCIFGHPIDDAVTNAIEALEADYAQDGVGGCVVFPAGRYIVVRPQPISSGVSFKGCGRGASKIYVTKIVSDANDSNNASWIRKASGLGQVVLDSVNLSDFTVIGTYYAASGVYGPDMKMINMSLTSNSTVQRMEIIDNPSTALGYDESINCLLADNIILNPGRLARIASVTGTAGGSGIGVAVSGQNKDISMVIRNNFIKGKWTSAGGTGRTGINIEASVTSSIPDTYYGGITIEGNIIEGMYNGIIDGGGIGTIVSNNQVRKCTRGIVSGNNGVEHGAMGRSMIITNNVVRDCFSYESYVGVGIQITASNANENTESRSIVANNIVVGTVGGYGIQINGTSTLPVRGCVVRDNIVNRNGLSGIRLSGTLFGIDVAGNMCLENGQSLTTGNRAAVSVGTNTQWTGGRIQNNTYGDYQTSPTQTANTSISGSAVLTNVRINGNTGDAN